MPDNKVLTELLESSKRVEALLVVLIGQQGTSGMPPAWRRRMAIEDEMDTVKLALDGTTAEDMQVHIRDRRGAGGGQR